MTKKSVYNQPKALNNIHIKWCILCYVPYDNEQYIKHLNYSGWMLCYMCL